jgi:hypothetical protein
MASFGADGVLNQDWPNIVMETADPKPVTA